MKINLTLFIPGGAVSCHLYVVNFSISLKNEHLRIRRSTPEPTQLFNYEKHDFFFYHHQNLFRKLR